MEQKKKKTPLQRRKRRKKRNNQPLFLFFLLGLIVVAASLFIYHTMNPFRVEYGGIVNSENDVPIKVIPKKPVLDKEDYDKRMEILANNPPPPEPAPAEEDTGDSEADQATGTTKPEVAVVDPVPPEPTLWPVETVYPNPGALLPFNRIVAYYGNFYSKGMGALGEYPEDEMLDMLKSEAKVWEAADLTTPVIPAIHYIAVTAQGSAGTEGKYILRMPDDQIEHALDLAKKVHGIVFLDIQAGLSNIRSEVKLLEPFLKLPNVHLGIDPEFNMSNGRKPGDYIGTLDASDINWTAEYLASLVEEYKLPPKIFVIHRFTLPMVTNYKEIKPLPEVQIVMHMDGWGSPEKKKNTYFRVVYSEPVQFAGIKVFYKNDLKPPSSGLMTPTEILKLRPRPIYIQYQ